MEQYIGIGRRKTSTARVFLRKGTGIVAVNKSKTPQDVLHRQDLILEALRPLAVTNQQGQWDVLVRVNGGGIGGQAQAISLGIARALLRADSAQRDVLRQHGLLTRDARVVERKKYGQPGARKQFQFSKR